MNWTWWARYTELALGAWLIASPLVFNSPANVLATDVVCGGLVILLALISFAPRLRYAHFAEVLPAFWLIGFGYFSSTPPAHPAHQNEIIIGLTLTMFCILPNDSIDAPACWSDYLTREDQPKPR